MSLYECSECGGKVSDKAPACPHCGNPATPDTAPGGERSHANAPGDINQDRKRRHPLPRAFVGAIAKGAGLSANVTERILQELIDIGHRNLDSIGRFSVPGLVALKASRLKATPRRDVINPFTRETVTIQAAPARTVLVARPSRELRARLADEIGDLDAELEGDGGDGIDWESIVDVGRDVAKEVLVEVLKTWILGGDSSS